MNTNNFESNVNYITKLSNFEGPIDFLLYLIKQAEIEVKDIFVSGVTEQFVEYVNNADIDMETKSEYLAIAAQIVEIKSKSIIPNETVEMEVEEMKEAFIQRVEEYKLYKETAKELKELEDVNRFYKAPDDDVGDVKVVYSIFNLENLVKAFKNLLEKSDFDEKVKNQQKEIPKEVFTVADKIQYIRSTLLDRGECSFYDLFSENSTKNEIITTFQAMLELLKLQYMKFEQRGAFDDITLILREDRSEDIGELSEYN